MKQFIQQTNDFNNNNNLSSSPQSNSWLLSNYGTSSNATNTTTTTAINNTTTKQQQGNNNNTLKQQLQQVTSLDLNADINSTKNNNSTTTTATSGLDSTKFFGKHLFDGYLELQDGTRFYGKSFGATKSNRPIVVNNTTFTTTDNTLDNSVDNNDDSDNDDNIWDTPYSVSGECVFTTAQVGYPESLTDPSYSGQILILTFPLIGNYGVPHFKKNQLPSTATMNNTTLLNTNIEIINNKNNNNQIIEWDDDLLPKLESNKIHIRGLIIQDYSNNYSHYEAICSLHRWLQEYNIPGLYNIDTRLLTKKLRNGTMLGRMIMDIKMFDQFNTSLQFNTLQNTLQQNNGINKWYDPGMDKNIIKKVSCKEIKIYGLGNFYKVIAIDCGIKYNIIRELIKRNIELKVVPYNYNWLNDIYNCNTNNNTNYGSDNDNSKNRIDGIFISNGPGNPNHFEITIQYLKQYINDCLLQQSQLQQQSTLQQQIPIIPIFGICLGNQLIAKAIGAKVYKLPFGNRGHNQPVIDQLTRRGFITSQNHGYAVDNQSLLEMSTSTTEITKYFKPYFLNANDASNEGIYCLNLPLFTCQFHPEAKGGPNDTLFLFDQFIDFMKLKKSGKLFKIYISSLLGNTNNKNDNNNFEPYYSRIYLKQHKSMRKKFNELLSSIEDTSDISTPILQQQSTLMKKSIFYNDNTDIDNNKDNNKQKELKGYSGRQIKLPKKVILLGSGGLQIGQAGEFDYSGSQAIKALKEEGIFTILINPNIATVQTCKDLADRVYFGPITPSYVEKVIIKEKADGLLLSFGGQTALNCGVNLYKSGILDKYGCKVLGTPVQSIIDTEDRDIFNRKMREINQPVAESVACDNVEEAITSANQLLGYPVIVRAAFALGGLGSGFANNDKELRELATQALSTSPQILVEKSVKGWKEIEYEVVRDSNDNCITVCNMENFDPVGIHTGESIVVAPSQTLNNDEYHMLRTAAIKVIRHLGIVGECNIQYALNPYNSNEYVIIEVNARLSRSSALASKATGYPLAFVAAKLALGMELIDIKNSVTKETCACFEPALDYCVVKIPRWDLKKFLRVSSELGSAMKSVGEVMAIGRNFEEAIQKALRMVDGSIRGFETTNSLFDYDKWLRSNNSNVGHGHSGHSHGHSHGHNLGHMNTNTLSTLPTVLHNNAKEELKQSIIKELTRPTDQRVFAIALAMEYFDMTVDQIHSYTQIDRWFLHKLNNIIQTRKHFKIIGKKVNHLLDIPYSLILCAKQQGFTDLQIASYISLDAFESYSEIINFYNENHEKNHVSNYIEKFRYTLSTTNYKQFTNIDKELLIRYIRKYIHKIEPIVKQIDTLAAEYPAQTNYLYMTYNAGINSIALPTNKENDKEVKFIYPDHHLHHDIEFNKEKGIIVLGSGVYRIGSSVEFDYCGVMCVRELRNKLGYKNVIMINYNPETVSTDFDEPNRLYFEELNFERVMDIYEIENQQYFNTCDSNSCDNSCDSDNNNGIMGMIVSVGGQQPNNIALSLEKQGNAKLLGSGADAIDMCENRFKFSNLLDSLNHNHHYNNTNNTTNTTTISTKLGKFKKNKLIYQPEWAALTTIEDALKFSNQPTIGYPVLIRPSYVLSGAAMNVAYSDNELLNYLYQAVDVSQEHPVVISKFYENAKEIEIDGVAMNGTIIVDAISEHVERAGTHSGDATLICPPYSLSFDLQDLVREKAALIVNALKISGPFNMQFLFDNEQSQSKNRNNYSPNFNGSSSDDDEENEEENDDFELSPLRSVDSVGSELSSLDEDEDYNSDYEYGSNNYYGKKERIKLYRNLSKRLKVIECNLRASRSFPFISKTLNVDFISLATRIMTGHFKLPNMELNNINDKDGPTSNYFEQMKLLKEISKLRLESNDTSFNESLQQLKDGDYKKFTKELTEYEMIQKRRFSKSFYGCKTSMFSFRRLADSDPKLGVEMASTGEVACFGQTVRDAFLKAMQSAYSNQLPTNPLTVNERSKNILIASFPHSTKSNMELINQILQSIYILYEYLQYTIYVTPYVAEKLSQQLPSVKFHTLQLQQIVPVDKNGICKSSLLKLDEESDILRKIAEDINFVVDVPFPDHNQKLLQQHYLIRRKTINYDKHLFFTYEVFNLYVRCLKDLKDKKMNLDNLNVHPYSHYLRLQSKDLNC